MFSILACTPSENVIVDETHTFSGGNWTLEDTAVIVFDIKDTAERFELNADVEVLKEFQHQNLYTNIIIDQPDRTRTNRICSFQLIDRGGYWLGECSGKSCSINSVIDPELNFSQLGEYKIRVAPHMRMDTIPSVVSIRLKLSKLK